MVRAYQQACAAVIQRFDGYIAQYLGDGLLVYFGYPQAHEDAAERAVRTGLGLVEAMGPLNTTLARDHGVRLAARVGVHTGLVVVGAMGSGDRQEHLALGATPNLAARLQGQAAPDTVVISAATHQLVQGLFTCQALDTSALKGLDQPLEVYQVLGASAASSRWEAAVATGLTPLVGREEELGLLRRCWAQVQEGHGQVVLLSGEAGIGKSRLVQVVKESVASAPYRRWECRSSPYYHNTALYPLIDLMQRTLHWQPGDAPEERLHKLVQHLRQYRLPMEESVPLFAALLALPVPADRYPPLHLSPQRQRRKTLESLVALLLELAAREPVLFILEDLHWTDPTTLEFLGLLMDHTPTASLSVLLTCRPEFQPPWHHRSYLTEITVSRLAREQIILMAAHVAGGKQLPDEVLQQIVDKTDGVPLFVEEQTKAVLESGLLQEVHGHYERTGSFAAFAIPATLHDSLMARLDRLGSAKGIAQLGAVVGRQFAYAVLHAVSPLDESTLQRELGRLVAAELLYQRGLPPQATYTFKHALIQDAAYQSLLKSTRQQYHQRIAQVLEAQFPAIVDTQPELLAQYYTAAGLSAQALQYWHQAGQQASQRSANAEAIAHLTMGLEMLSTLPESPARLQYELDLLTALGPVFVAARGQAAPEVEHAYARARALCQQVGETAELFPVLFGLLQFYANRAEYRTARELAEELLTLSLNAPDPLQRLVAHRAVGTVAFYLGELRLAHTHVEHAFALYAHEQHHATAALYGQDLGVSCCTYAGLALLWLGYPAQALRQFEEALTLARALEHPYTLARALAHMAAFHHCRREVHAVQAQAEAAMTLSTEQGFPYWFAWGSIFRGWARAEQGQRTEGLTEMRQGLAAYRVTGSALDWPRCLALLAEGLGKAGQADEGLHILGEALATVATTGERFYETELYRLQGELMMARATDKQQEAEACFQQALTVARQQEAKLLELRAAMSLARLWQQQGQRTEAHALLAPIYGWFTEGFDTADLQEAKVLLEELA